MSKATAPTGPPYSDIPSDFKKSYSASCFCGTTQWELQGDALSSMYCHCETCQRLHGAPYQWAAIIHKTHMRFTSPISTLFFYSASRKEAVYDLPVKVSCKECRSPIMDEGRNMLLLFPEFIQFPRDESDRKVVPTEWKASHHMFYGRRVADMHDGLEKYLTKKGEGKCDDEGRPIDGEKL